jgi:hypothetical protein
LLISKVDSTISHSNRAMKKSVKSSCKLPDSSLEFMRRGSPKRPSLLAAATFIALLSAVCLFPAARIASAELTTVSVGGTSIALPSPEGFFRYDGKSAKVDASNQQAAPAGNRLVADFGSEEALAEVLADRFPKIERNFNVQTTRNIESLAFTPTVFDQMKSVLRGMVASQTQYRDVVKDIETNVSAAIGSRFTLGDAIPLGIFDETSDSLSFSVLMKAQTASGNNVLIAACSVVRVNNRVVSLYATSLYRNKFDIEWARRSVQRWRDAVLAANAR